MSDKKKVVTKISKQDGEYRVRLFIDGVYQAGADYFTDDRSDARQTAEAIAAGAKVSDKTTGFAQDEQADYDGQVFETALFDDADITCVIDKAETLCLNWEMVSKHTIRVYNSEGDDEAFNACKDYVNALVKEVDRREFFAANRADFQDFRFC